MQIFISLFAACIIVFPIYLISSAISGSVKNQQSIKQKAITQGHIVTAVLKKRTAYRRNVPGVQNGRVRLGIYEYEYNGKKYKYRYWANTPPTTLTLYFVKNPRKATVENALINSNICWPLVYAIVAIIAYLVVMN